ncbi:hypothetical protein IQ07DRAFT_349921 [Pyrenochaeta sp. DS3sAY3a]|nr:hypothetical protein IQ07DRAFT_349921 [Pyrenochaeta sp. DS3sAY3a]
MRALRTVMVVAKKLLAASEVGQLRWRRCCTASDGGGRAADRNPRADDGMQGRQGAVAVGWDRAGRAEEYLAAADGGCGRDRRGCDSCGRRSVQKIVQELCGQMLECYRTPPPGDRAFDIALWWPAGGVSSAAPANAANTASFKKGTSTSCSSSRAGRGRRCESVRLSQRNCSVGTFYYLACLQTWHAALGSAGRRPT